MHQSTKTYGHDIGLSACFRQWRAESHCHYLHGYALAVKLTFQARGLDDRNWVMDFGGLKEVKRFLEGTFDHALVIAQDDPEKPLLYALARAGIARIVELPAVGCEAFAEHIFWFVHNWLAPQDRVSLVSVEVREHGANSAIFFPATA